MYLAGILPGLLIALAQMVDRARLCEDLQLPGVSALHGKGVLPLRLAIGAGVVSRRSSSSAAILLGWFHGDRIGGGVRGDSTRRCCPCSSTARVDMKQLYHALSETGKLAAVALFLRGHRLGVRLAARVLPDPQGRLLAKRDLLGTGASRAWVFFIAFRVPGGSAASSTPSRRSSSSAPSCSPLAQVGEHAPESISRSSASSRSAFGPGDPALRGCA